MINRVPIASAETVELWTSAAANVATAGALIVGAIWAYLRFFRQRTEKARAMLSYTASHRRLGDDLLLRATVAAENTGSVLIGVQEVRCEIRQVAPLPAETEARLRERELINEQDEAELHCIRCYEKKWGEGEAEIEPGETDTFDFDFVVSGEIETVLIYAHLPNVMRKDDGGWEVSGFYDLNVKAPTRPPGDTVVRP
jgi:hypothetical protein